MLVDINILASVPVFFIAFNPTWYEVIKDHKGFAKLTKTRECLSNLALELVNIFHCNPIHLFINHVINSCNSYTVEDPELWRKS